MLQGGCSPLLQPIHIMRHRRSSVSATCAPKLRPNAPDDARMPATSSRLPWLRARSRLMGRRSERGKSPRSAQTPAFRLGGAGLPRRKWGGTPENSSVKWLKKVGGFPAPATLRRNKAGLFPAESHGRALKVAQSPPAPQCVSFGRTPCARGNAYRHSVGTRGHGAANREILIAPTCVRRLCPPCPPSPTGSCP